GADRRTVDDEQAAPCARGDTVGPEQDGLDVVRVAHADDDGITRCGELSRARRLSGPELDERPASSRAPVPDREREALSRDVGGHRLTHRPESNEADSLALLHSASVGADPAREDDPVLAGKVIVGPAEGAVQAHRSGSALRLEPEGTMEGDRDRVAWPDRRDHVARPAGLGQAAEAPVELPADPAPAQV